MAAHHIHEVLILFLYRNLELGPQTLHRWNDAGELNHRALVELAKYETYHADETKPDIRDIVKEYKSQAWSRGDAGKIKTRSLELVRPSRSLAGRVEEEEGDEIPDEPEDLAEIETTARGRKGKGKKKNLPKKKKLRKASPKKQKAKSKAIAKKGQDRGRRGRKEAKANKESSQTEETKERI